MKHLEKFITQVQESITNKAFIKIIVSNKRDKQDDLKSVHLKLILLKDKQVFNVVYRHNTKDLTKNFSIAEAITLLKNLVQNQFYQAVLHSTTADYNLLLRKDQSTSFKKSKASIKKVPALQHDKDKKKFILPENNIYLQELGIVSASGNVFSAKQKKFKQINKYIEIISKVLSVLPPKENIRVVDMGSGKGYLTFALYDYLKNNTNINAQITGVEIRKELIAKCNAIAQKSDFDQLFFEQSTIETISIKALDVLIALHACDTATDDAIYKGIESNAKIIICAPCCHKQIRKELKPSNALEKITQFGILKERQAEILTDTLRALYLESMGYKTQVFEFISTEHTPKNVLIVAVKKQEMHKVNIAILDEIEQIKKLYGIESHYLGNLLKVNKLLENE